MRWQWGGHIKPVIAPFGYARDNRCRCYLAGACFSSIARRCFTGGGEEGNGGSDLLLSVFPTTSGPTVFIDADDSAPAVSLPLLRRFGLQGRRCLIYEPKRGDRVRSGFHERRSLSSTVFFFLSFIKQTIVIMKPLFGNFSLRGEMVWVKSKCDVRWGIQSSLEFA